MYNSAFYIPNGASGKLKETGTSYWTAPNADATNATGFSARGAGYYNSAGSTFSSRGHAYFWTGTSVSTNVWFYNLLSNNTNIYHQNNFWRSMGMSIRCVKD